MKRFTAHRQLDSMDCGPTCLRMVAEHYGKQFSQSEIVSRVDFGVSGTSIAGIVQAAESFRIKAMPVELTMDELTGMAPLPCVVHWHQQHFLVVYHISRKWVYVADPAIGKLKYSHADFKKGWMQGRDKSGKGIVILFEPEQLFYEQEDEIREKKGISFLLPYLRPYKKEGFQLLIGLLVLSVINVLFPFITQAVVDKGIGQGDVQLIWILLFAQIVLFISRLAAEIIRDWLLLHAGARINLSLLTDFLKKMMRLQPAFFSSRQIGDLIQRVGDHQRIERFLSSQSLLMIFSIFNLVLFGGILAVFSVYVFLWYFLGTTLYIIWVLGFLKRRKKIDEMQFQQASNNQSALVQIIQGVQEIKLNSSGNRRRKEWEESQVGFYRVEMKKLALFHIQRSGGNFISQIKNVLILFFAALAVIDGNMTLGTLMSIIYIIGQLNGPINSFIDFVLGYQDAKISLDRLSDVYNEPDEDPGGRGNRNIPSRESIVFSNVTFNYPGNNKKVFEKINLEIQAGKVNAIVGVSGSGKTTLLKLILKMYTNYEGEILLGKKSLRDYNSDAWRQQCGVVMQDGFIFRDSIRRNITESDSESSFDQERFDQALKVANLQQFVADLPYGVESRVEANGSNLSGGQRQRILIARAIYCNPKYIFFDEATSSLDAENEKTIMDNLDEFFAMDDKTVIVIAHRLSTVKNADNILVFDRGEVVEQGDHASLIAKRGTYFNLIQNQLELGGS